MSNIRASIYGRAGADAQSLTTRSDKPMARVSLAVDVSGFNAEQSETEWVTVVAFGRLAEVLAGHKKGDMIAASGNLSRNRWKKDGGEERVTWQLVADDVCSTRSVRPSGGKKRGTEGVQQRETVPAGRQTIGDDDIPW